MILQHLQKKNQLKKTPNKSRFSLDQNVQEYWNEEEIEPKSSEEDLGNLPQIGPEKIKNPPGFEPAKKVSAKSSFLDKSECSSIMTSQKGTKATKRKKPKKGKKNKKMVEKSDKEITEEESKGLFEYFTRKDKKEKVTKDK